MDKSVASKTADSFIHFDAADPGSNPSVADRDLIYNNISSFSKASSFEFGGEEK